MLTLMWNAMTISASGLAASAAQFSRAASKIANAFDNDAGPASPGTAQPVPASPPNAPPAAPVLAGSNAVAVQQDQPSSWMVEILKAKAAYRASAAAFNAASQMQRQAIDLAS